MKIVATIEARMTSTRLPGKVMLPVMGKPMLHYLVERLKLVPSIDEIVLATTTNDTDDVLAEFAKEKGIDCFRGSEDDVMLRVAEAAESVNADVIVEISGDCPILDPEIVEQTISVYKSSDVDYVHNKNFPAGVGDIQVFSLEVLKKSLLMTNDPLHHEHVTMHIRNSPHLFTKTNLIASPELNAPELEVLLDEKDDYTLIKAIIEHFAEENPLFDCADIINFLRNRPDLVAINAHVHRKGET